MRKILSLFVFLCFLTNTILPQAIWAQEIILPKPGTMVFLSPAFTPAYLKGMVINPNDPFKFDFIIDRGEVPLSEVQKQEEYTRLIKYFLAALAVPDEQQWVNLSPYEKDRIIPATFGLTEMGRDLLAEDYMLKQITASMIYPEDAIGKKFWKQVYRDAANKFGTTNVPVNTFNKVWIIPDKAVVYEKGNTVYVLENHLKVMLEEDYLALSKHQRQAATSTIGSRIVREIVLPALEKEVNEGRNFAPLRQVFSGMLLATWYKRSLKESILGKLYANKGKVRGVDQDPKNNQLIYNRYLQAYKKGVFNLIKEDTDQYTYKPIPRKYFSGGMGNYAHLALQSNDKPNFAQIVAESRQADLASIVLRPPQAVPASSAMLTPEGENPGAIAMRWIPYVKFGGLTLAAVRPEDEAIAREAEILIRILQQRTGYYIKKTQEENEKKVVIPRVSGRLPLLTLRNSVREEVAQAFNIEFGRLGLKCLPSNTSFVVDFKNAFLKERLDNLQNTLSQTSIRIKKFLQDFHSETVNAASDTTPYIEFGGLTLVAADPENMQTALDAEDIIGSMLKRLGQMEYWEEGGILFTKGTGRNVVNITQAGTGGQEKRIEPKEGSILAGLKAEYKKYGLTIFLSEDFTISHMTSNMSVNIVANFYFKPKFEDGVFQQRLRHDLGELNKFLRPSRAMTSMNAPQRITDIPLHYGGVPVTFGKLLDKLRILIRQGRNADFEKIPQEKESILRVVSIKEDSLEGIPKILFNRFMSDHRNDDLFARGGVEFIIQYSPDFRVYFYLKPGIYSEAEARNILNQARNLWVNWLSQRLIYLLRPFMEKAEVLNIADVQVHPKSGEKYLTKLFSYHMDYLMVILKLMEEFKAMLRVKGDTFYVLGEQLYLDWQGVGYTIYVRSSGINLNLSGAKSKALFTEVKRIWSDWINRKIQMEHNPADFRRAIQEARQAQKRLDLREGIADAGHNFNLRFMKLPEAQALAARIIETPLLKGYGVRFMDPTTGTWLDPHGVLSLTEHALGPQQELGVITVVPDSSRVSPAMTSPAQKGLRGGIDFSKAFDMQIKRDGKGMVLPVSEQDLDSIHINGLVPVILEIRPAAASPILAQLTTPRTAGTS